MQRRGGGGASGYRQTNNSLPNFKPRNMSHPSPNDTNNIRSKINHPVASTSTTNLNMNQASGGGLLHKLRKQFHSGHHHLR
ncbi:unnamed protein product [Schistosoma turkestanicum]|nr:unnamed protein product [Schistosoma turkestanicum]